MYITYEEPLAGRTFTKNQMKEIYRDMACKLVFPDFECWFADMLKSGVFEEVKQRSRENNYSIQEGCGENDKRIYRKYYKGMQNGKANCKQTNKRKNIL